MKRLLIWGLLLWAGSLLAQPPDTLWTRTYGGADWDEGHSVQQTADSGYIIAGYTYSFGAGGADVYLIKTDANGDSIWTRTYGGTADDGGWSVQQTADGGYIITGSTNSFGVGADDVYLIRTNSNGDTLWTKTYGGTDVDGGFSVQQTSDSGYIIAGVTNSFGVDTFDVYFIKTNANGDTLWTKTYGGVDDDWGWSVQQSTDGGYIVAGHTYSFGAGTYDVYLIKTDANGDTLWVKTYGGTNWDVSRSVQQTSDGGYIIAGWTNSFGPGDFDVYLIKTDANGDTLWTRTYGSADDGGWSVQQTTDGGYIIAGGTYSFGDDDVYLIKTNANGDTLWTKVVGREDNDEIGYSVQQTTDGGYIVAGSTYLSGAGGYDVYLIKTEPDIGIEEETNKKVSDFRIPGLVYDDILRWVGINKHIDIRIFDILGREVLKREVTPQNSYVRLSSLTPGVYFIFMKEEKLRLSKFILIR